jgi:PrgI family protein
MHEQYIVTIPSDVERDDHLLGNLTARQLAIIIPAAAVAWLGYLATDTLLPLPISAALAVVLLGAATALTLVERDGVSLDRLLIYAIIQRSQPRHLVPAPEKVPPVPGWMAATGTAPERASAVPAPLHLPARAIRSDGVIDLGGEGVVALVGCSTVSFALRTPGEQAALVSAFGGWLNSLAGPVQILVRAQPVNLAPAITLLRDQAAGLPHPALEEAALDHAAFLTELARARELLARQVLIVLREPYSATGSGLVGESGARDVEGAATRVLRRADQTTRALGAAGINARLLDAGKAAAALAAAADPTAPPMNPGTAAPDEVITASAGGHRQQHAMRRGCKAGGDG